MHFDSFLRQTIRTLRLFLLAQWKEELRCSETVVESFAWLLWEKSHDYLRLKKNALLLRYSRIHTSFAILHIYTDHPHPVSLYANHPTTFPFSLNFIDFLYRSIALENELLMHKEAPTNKDQFIVTTKHLKAKAGEENECPNARTNFKTRNSNLIKR